MNASQKDKNKSLSKVFGGFLFPRDRHMQGLNYLGSILDLPVEWKLPFTATTSVGARICSISK